MTEKEKLDAIRTEIHRLVDVRGYDREMANDLFAFMDSLPNEHVSEDLEEIAWNHADKKCHLDIAVFTPDEIKKERGKMQFTWQDLYDAVMFGAKWQKIKDESTTEDLGDYIDELSKQFPDVSFAKLSRIAVRVAKWQEKQDQSTIELAEDHAYFAGRTKTMDEINEALLSEVLPCFMHGGEADEVVAMLDEKLLKGE